MPDRDLSRIDALSEDRISEWKRRNATTYLECAISLMLTSMSKQRVVEILRQEARMLIDLD